MEPDAQQPQRVPATDPMLPQRVRARERFRATEEAATLLPKLKP